MSHSPATPDQAAITAMESPTKLAMPSTEKMASCSKGKRASLTEPSPTSTYGETAGSSTNPATPLEVTSHDAVASITDSMRATQLDPAIASISGSPMPAQGAKYCPQAGLQSSKVAIGSQAYSSPAKTGRAGIHMSNGSGSSSPTSDRAQAILHAPTWRGHPSENLVQVSDSHADDPFVSNGHVSATPALGVSTSPARNPDRVGEEPTNINAQAIFPPQACVFVANLAQDRTDDRLEIAVTAAFSRFGNVYAKVRRDAQGLPFAFAQFETVENAKRAVQHGNGLVIEGRGCRTEVARANRAIYLSKIAGGAVSNAEARQAMAGHGLIEQVWIPSQTEREMFSLPEGIFVRFQYFDDCKKALGGFHTNEIYRIEQPKAMDIPRPHQGGHSHQHSSPQHAQPSPQRISPLSTGRANRPAAIYVGNLPAFITEEALKTVFLPYGHITATQIIRKPSALILNGVNVYAFIEYASMHGATYAVRACPRDFHGHRLRVEHKDTSAGSPRARSSFNGSPHRGGAFNQSPEALIAMSFQRGITVGMSQLSQAQVIQPPAYTPYPFYGSYGTSQGQYGATAATANNDNNTSSIQAYGTGYIPQAVGQYGYQVPSAPMLPYDQGNAHYTGHATPDQYQWTPLVEANNDYSISGSGITSPESH